MWKTISSVKDLLISGFVSKRNHACLLSPHVSFLTYLPVLFLAELYEIFLSRAKERWRSFRETGSEVEAEGMSPTTPCMNIWTYKHRNPSTFLLCFALAQCELPVRCQARSQHANLTTAFPPAFPHSCFEAAVKLWTGLQGDGRFLLSCPHYNLLFLHLQNIVFFPDTAKRSWVLRGFTLLIYF